MALTTVNIESWAAISETKQAWVCRRLKEASEEGGAARSQIRYAITDKRITYTFKPSVSSPIESSLAVDLAPTVVHWVDFNGAMVFVLAHMLVLSHLYQECRFHVDADRDHRAHLQRAYDIARGVIPQLPLPEWLDDMKPFDGSLIDRPEWLDFTR